MEKLEQYCSRLIRAGAINVRVIDPRSVVTAPWVRLKCQYGCRGYGKGHACPPSTPTPEQTRSILDSYTTAILAHLQHSLAEITPQIREFPKATIELEKALFLDGYYKAFAILAGPCMLCKECNYPAEVCRFPGEVRPSMEACGIDVYQTARNHGLPVKSLRTKNELGNYYFLVLVE